MKSKLLSSLIVTGALVSAIAFGFAAKEAKDTAPRVKPALRVDNSPVSDGKSGVVTSYADVVEPALKSVVSIYSSKIVKERIQVNPFFRQFGFQDQERESKQEGMGSGVIVSADGYILTNNHVVEGADELKVSLSDDREFIAKVIGTDPKTDIAVVKIEADKLPTVTLANSDKVRVGDVVFAVGNPLNVGQTVTMGIISAKGRHVGILDEKGYEDFIQTDAAINMGNSGGALVDAKGRLIGINSAILSAGTGSRGNIGIGFAIPINLAASIMNSLIETGTVTRGALGAYADPLTPDVAEQLGLAKDSKGIVVTDVVPHSAAEKAGIKRTDVILALNDHPIVSFDELRLQIAQMMPGSIVKLRVVRDGKERIVNATLDKLTENPNELFPGVNVAKLDSPTRRKLGIDERVNGLIVTDVAADSPLREVFFPNLVIREINRLPVPDLAAAKEALNAASVPGRNLVAIYTPRGGNTFVVVTMK